jgi:hypothetical protein
MQKMLGMPRSLVTARVERGAPHEVPPVSDEGQVPQAQANEGPSPSSRRRLVLLGLLFLLLAGLQVWVVLTSGAATVADAALAQVALDPLAERWVLRETGPEARPVATVLHDPNGHRLLLAAPGLPPPGRGTYVLWYLRPGGVAPEVVAAFRPTRSGADLVVKDAPSPRELAGLAVTAEPDEGRPSRMDPSRVRARYETGP